MRTANEQRLVIAQIETKAGLDCVESIAAVEGIDVLWVGQTDLTNSMGIPGQFEHADFREAPRRVVAAARDHGKQAGFMAMSEQDGRAMYDLGFRCLAYSGDLWVYQNALRSGIDAFRRFESGE